MPTKDIKFRKYEGKSGKTWLVGITEDWKNHIYVSASKEESKAEYKGSRGFDGRTLEFKLENGNTMFLQGPWHSNPNLFLADVKEIQSTFKL